MAITWVENMPSGTSPVGTAPPFLTTVWAAISNGFGTQGDLFWDGGGGASAASAGILKPGASRPFFAVQSASSAPNSQMTARAFLASDTSRLLLYESAGTYLGGTPYLVEHIASATTGFWVRQSSTTFIASTGTPVSQSITFPVRFAATPIVHQTLSEQSFFGGVASLFSTVFTSVFSWTGAGTQSGVTIEWWALGRVVSGV